MQEEWFVAIKIIYMESPITMNIYEVVFKLRLHGTQQAARLGRDSRPAK